MSTYACRKFSSIERNTAPATWVIFASFYVALIAGTGSSRAETKTSLPKVLMLELHGLTPNDPGMYRAIKAQLSASPLALDRIELDPEQTVAFAPFASASKTAADHQATMVFWIEYKETCRLFFYLPGPNGGSINSRVLNLDFDIRSNRFEVIGIAAASMIEELLFSLPRKPEPSTEITPAAPLAPIEKENHTRKGIEIFVAYAGSYFAAEMVTHGAQLGLGVIPIRHLVIQASFRQDTPLTTENEKFRFTIVSRGAQISTAGQIVLNSVDIRLGLAWSIDLRSHSTVSLSDRVAAEPDGFKGVNALMPFVSLKWHLNNRVGLFGCLGANLAINDTIYNIVRDDSPVTAVAPFAAKLAYQLGLIVQL